MTYFQNLFASLTQPQADVVTAGTTLVSALIVALIAPLMFHLLTNKSFRSFSKASEILENAAQRVELQAETVGKGMDKITARVADFGKTLSSLQESVARTQNTLIESQSAETTAPHAATDIDDSENRERIKALWRAVQSLVEQAAANEDIDSDLKAKYTRWDRRNYLGLIEAIHGDGKLPGVLSRWQDAYGMGQQAIRGAGPILDAAVQKMEITYGILSSPFHTDESQKTSTSSDNPAQYTRPTMERFKGVNKQTPPNKNDDKPSGDEPLLAH